MKPRVEIVVVCCREGNPLVQPDPRGCRALGMGNPLAPTRAHLEHRHVRCDLHNRPIVFVSVGMLAHLPPIEERAPC